jgi:hypothetical protein
VFGWLGWVRCGGSAYTRLGAIYIHPHIQRGLGRVRWERRRLEWNGMDMGCGWMARHAWLGMGRLLQPFRPARGLGFQAPLRVRTRVLGRGLVRIMFLALDPPDSLWSGLAVLLRWDHFCRVFFGLPSAGACMASSSSLSKSKA